MDTSANTTLLCQPSTGQEDDWKNLYESSFPQDERMTADDIRQHLSKGTMTLHKTLNKNGELLCFSLVFPVSDFVLLSYIATDPTKRSGGFGSKHMRRLVEILKAQYPNHLGMFLEIESTKEQGLDPATQKARLRRLDFYQRLGAKRLCKNYLWPSMVPGASPRAGELLWVEFGGKVIDDSVLPRVILEIYERAYLLQASDPIIQKVLAQFSAGSRGGPASVCTIPTAPAPAVPNPAAPDPAAPDPAAPATATPDPADGGTAGAPPAAPQASAADSKQAPPAAGDDKPAAQ